MEGRGEGLRGGDAAARGRGAEASGGVDPGETAGVRRPPGGQEAVPSGAESGNGGRTYPGREEREHAWPGGDRGARPPIPSS